MKPLPWAARTAALLVLFCLLPSLASAAFCWKATEYQGVGKIPTNCSGGKENNAGLCYPKCQAGYTGVGPVCWQNCPSGYNDFGVGCSKPAAYGRGAGYAWHFGDPLNDSGMYNRCQRDNGRGNCEKWGAVVYPKCKPNYHPVGCCVCSPDCPGMTDSGASCTKYTKTRGVGTIPDVCSGSDVNSYGLCYRGCPSAFNATAIGPVCWKKCKGDTPFECGGGCAKDADECRANLVNQAIATANFVIQINQFIETGGIWASYQEMWAGGKASFILSLKGMIKALALPNTTRDNIRNAVRQAWPDANDAQVAALTSILAGDDFDITAIDQTGITSLAMAYTAPICK